MMNEIFFFWHISPKYIDFGVYLFVFIASLFGIKFIASCKLDILILDIFSVYGIRS